MHIHLVGIAGSLTAPLALTLKKQGNLITGSDQEKTYPPFGPQLKNADIPINQTPIDSQIDLAIIASSYNSFSKTREEFEAIKSRKIPYISATNYISQNIIKKNSILVAGSFGKTTISAALCYLLIKANFNPSYMFGGQAINKLESLRFSNSNWSVTEADESINGLDTQAKFLYYPVKYLILTSAQWEHKDSYRNEQENFNAFKKLIENLPLDGLLIYNSSDSSISSLLPFIKCQKIAYQSTKIPNNLIGKHNQENLGAVETLATYLHIPPKTISSAFKSFKGIRRRLELCAQSDQFKFIDDFAQGANRIKSALQAVKDTYPNSRIKVFYEAHASFLQYRSNLNELSSVFDQAYETVIFRLKFNNHIDSQNRLIAKDFTNTIPRSIYLPLAVNVIKHYRNTLESGDILIHFSSGGAEGLKIFKKIIRLFRKQ